MAATTDILEGLNDRQREAVETIDGPLLIVAGPGSGKTRVITHRIAYLVKVCGMTPHRIAAVTFTNRAAREMRERLASLLGEGVHELTASTYHAFCSMVLRRESDQIGLARDYSIYDDADQIAQIKRAMQDLNVDPVKFPPRVILSSISRAKSELIGAEGFGLNSDTYFKEIVFRVYTRYEELNGLASAVDFDDLLLKTYLLFQQSPDVLSKYSRRFIHLMIDEFQDTNVAQYAIARQLSESHRNLCVVGDPDQSIYSWRNADIRNILSFQKDFPDAKVIPLEESYRSTQTILDAAKSLISPNEERVEKGLWTQNGQGVPIVVSEGFNEREEAQDVVKELRGLVQNDRYTLSDIAVMYRVNAQSRALEEACLRYGIPYQLVGSLRFYQRQEIKDLTAYLRLIANPNDDVSLGRVVNMPARGIGQRTLDELTRWARHNGQSMIAGIDTLAGDREEGRDLSIPVAARSAQALIHFRSLINDLAEESRSLELPVLIDRVLERTGYRDHVALGERAEERLENLQEYRNTTRDFLDLEPGEALPAFLQSVALVSDVDNLEEKADAITLVTLHQAKGLEFPVVFIVGMEEGLLPHRRALEDPAQMEEERRLCYVGVTRAKERLFLYRAFRRRRGSWGGGGEVGTPSRFLSDIPRKLIVAGVTDEPEDRGSLGWASRSKRRAAASTASRTVVRSRPADDEIKIGARAGAAESGARKPSLVTGDKVRHAAFGDGIVTDAKAIRDDVEVTVAFKDGNGVKRLLLSLAPLEKVEAGR